MADSSAPLAFGLLPVVSEKLTRGNYIMWHATVTSALKGTRLFAYVQGTAVPPSPFLTDPSASATAGSKEEPKPNTAYEKWESEDQIVLSYLFNSLSKEIFGQVTTAKTAAELWAAIQALHASQSRAHVMSTRLALTTASKGASNMAEYFVKMKGLADDMASAGKKLEDEELVSFILAGLGDDFESIVTAMASRVEPISVNELYAQLIAFEQRKEISNGANQSSANLVAKGGRAGNSSNSNHPRGNGGRPDSGYGGFRRNNGGRGNGGRGNGGNTGDGSRSTFLQGVFCQLCGKESVIVLCIPQFVTFN